MPASFTRVSQQSPTSRFTLQCLVAHSVSLTMKSFVSILSIIVALAGVATVSAIPTPTGGLRVGFLVSITHTAHLISFTGNPAAIPPTLDARQAGNNGRISSPAAPSSTHAASRPAGPKSSGVLTPACRVYVAVPGDICIGIAQKTHISLAQFFAKNRNRVNAQCTNLVPGRSYCV